LPLLIKLVSFRKPFMAGAARRPKTTL